MTAGLKAAVAVVDGEGAAAVEAAPEATLAEGMVPALGEAAAAGTAAPEAAVAIVDDEDATAVEAAPEAALAEGMASPLGEAAAAVTAPSEAAVAIGDGEGALAVETAPQDVATAVPEVDVAVEPMAARAAALAAAGEMFPPMPTTLPKVMGSAPAGQAPLSVKISSQSCAQDEHAAVTLILVNQPSGRVETRMLVAGQAADEEILVEQDTAIVDAVVELKTEADGTVVSTWPAPATASAAGAAVAGAFVETKNKVKQPAIAPPKPREAASAVSKTKQVAANSPSKGKVQGTAPARPKAYAAKANAHVISSSLEAPALPRGLPVEMAARLPTVPTSGEPPRSKADQGSLERELKEARMRGQLQAAKSEVASLHDCVERQQDELEQLKRDLQKALRQRQQLRDEVRRSTRKSSTGLDLQLVESDPWKDQMKNLCLSGAVDTAQKQQQELQEALHHRMRRDAAWEAREERQHLLRSFIRSKQAVQEADEVAQLKRIAWAEQRRQHVLRGELIDAETRASRHRMQQEAEAAERQRLLREQLLDERMSRARAATMTRSASKPVLPALGRVVPGGSLTSCSALASCATDSSTCLDYKLGYLPHHSRSLKGPPKARAAASSVGTLPPRGFYHDPSSNGLSPGPWSAGRFGKVKGIVLPTALPPLIPPASATGLPTTPRPPVAAIEMSR